MAMNPEESLASLETLMNELKILMSSFHPDSKLAELMRQATMKAHRESDISKKLHIAVALLWAILVVVIIGFIMGGVFIGWLAE